MKKGLNRIRRINICRKFLSEINGVEVQQITDSMAGQTGEPHFKVIPENNKKRPVVVYVLAETESTSQKQIETAALYVAEGYATHIFNQNGAATLCLLLEQIWKSETLTEQERLAAMRVAA